MNPLRQSHVVYYRKKSRKNTAPKRLLLKAHSVEHYFALREMRMSRSVTQTSLPLQADEITQLLLHGQDKRTLRRSSSGIDLSISADGDCIVHGESRLRIFLRNSTRARELSLRGALKRSCFSRNGKWIYVWSRTHQIAMDHWQVFQVASNDQTPFLHSHHSFVSSLPGQHVHKG